MSTLQPVPSPLLSNPATATGPAAVSRDRERRTPSVVHLGVGGLRHAHHTLLLDDLARTRTSTDRGLVHVELRAPGTPVVIDLDQVGGHGVSIPGPHPGTQQEVDVLLDLVTSAEDSETVVETLAAPTTQLVTLQTADGGTSPCRVLPLPTGELTAGTVLAHGYLVQALARRRSVGLLPFTVLSCDPLPRNGENTRELVLDRAREVDPDLAVWIGEHGRFPGSIIDDLLPGPDGRPFRWFVEDAFCEGRPPVELVGARLVPSTAPYEQLRRRLLHGARTALALVARSTGAGSTDRALADPRLSAFLDGFLAEAASSLLSVPGTDLETYRARVLERLADPRTGEPLAPLNARSAEALAAFVLPSLRQALDHRRPRGHLVLALAAWCRALPGADTDAASLLQHQRTVVGTLADDPHLVRELAQALTLLDSGAFDPAPTNPAPTDPVSPRSAPQEVSP